MSYKVKKDKHGSWLFAFDLNNEPKGMALITELKPFKPKKTKKKLTSNKAGTKE